MQNAILMCTVFMKIRDWNILPVYIIELNNIDLFTSELLNVV